MPDPNAIGIALYYIDDQKTMEDLCAFLIKKGEWFDVRRPVIHKWSLTMSAIVAPPKTLRKMMKEPEATAQQGVTQTRINIDNYKAGRKAMMKGNRR